MTALSGIPNQVRSTFGHQHLLRKVDRQLLKWAYQRPYEDSPLIKALIFVGDIPFWLIVVFIAAFAGEVLNSEPFRELVIQLVFGLIVGGLACSLCKAGVKRRRPYANNQLQQDLNMRIQNRDPGHASKEFESFPSGHVLWTTICVCLICSQSGNPFVLLIGWMIPAMVFLRLHLGVHYPSDVFASLVLGSISVALTSYVAPGIIEAANGLREHAGYLYGYWALIGSLVIAGYKVWSKRV
jgi:membrane-associated phospholipid phosphatase